MLKMTQTNARASDMARFVVNTVCVIVSIAVTNVILVPALLWTRWVTCFFVTHDPCFCSSETAGGWIHLNRHVKAHISHLPPLQGTLHQETS